MFMGFQGLEFGIVFWVLDLLTSILSLKTCSSAMGSPEFLEFAGGLLHLLCRLDDGAWEARASKLVDSTGAWSLRKHPPPLSAPTPGGSGSFHRFLLLRGLP
jgi:hypothetical protein